MPLYVSCIIYLDDSTWKCVAFVLNRARINDVTPKINSLCTEHFAARRVNRKNKTIKNGNGEQQRYYQLCGSVRFVDVPHNSTLNADLLSAHIDLMSDASRVLLSLYATLYVPTNVMHWLFRSERFTLQPAHQTNLISFFYVGDKYIFGKIYAANIFDILFDGRSACWWMVKSGKVLRICNANGWSANTIA